MNNRPLIIDFVGKWGAGKTYLKNRVLENLSARYKCLDLYDYKLSVSEHFRFFISCPGVCAASLLMIFSAAPGNYATMCRLLRTWFSTQIKTEKARKLDYDFCFIDEGIFRRLADIRINTLRKPFFPDMPMEVKKKFLYPDLVVFVHTDFNLSEQRRMKRDAGKKILIGRTSEKAAELLQCMEESVAHAKKESLVKDVFYYDNNGVFDGSLTETILGFKNGDCRGE